MSVRRTIFAATYDRQTRTMERGGLRELRHGLLAHAAGRVLEVGAGTGANLEHYGSAVTSLTMTEPDAAMLKRLRPARAPRLPTTTVLRAPAEDLPFDDASLDAVVSTLVLCGVDDQPRVVREIRRVLRPRGRLLLIEHVRATDPKASRRQDRLNWLNRLVCCDRNRPTLQTLMHGGFDVATIVAAELPNVPPVVRPADHRHRLRTGERDRPQRTGCRPPPLTAGKPPSTNGYSPSSLRSGPRPHPDP